MDHWMKSPQTEFSGRGREQFLYKVELRSKRLVNNAIEGFYQIILIEGLVFDEGVNEQRDGFDKIPEEDGDGDLLNELQVTFEDIYAVLDTTVEKLLTPPAWSKDEIVAKVGVNYCVSEDMLTHSSTRVRFGDTPVSVAKRALGNLQNMVVDETESLLRMKDAITDLAPDSDDFRRKINDLSWEYTASLKTVDMANLWDIYAKVHQNRIGNLLPFYSSKLSSFTKYFCRAENRLCFGSTSRGSSLVSALWHMDWPVADINFQF